jgi:aminodeoxyfutalosine deaminase
MSVPPAVDAVLTALPKAELHVHLEGSLPPDLLFELAAKHRVPGIPTSRDAVRSWYEFRDFPHFIEVYLTALDVLRGEEDFARLAHAVITDLARQNVRYAEINVSLFEHLRRGLSAEIVFAGIEAGRTAVEDEHDIAVRWVPDFSGQAGPDAGERTLDAVIEHGPSSVVGFSVAGIEVERDQFADVFARARAAGLHSLPHAGETHGPDRVWSAVRALGAERIGHGIGAMRDPALVEHLVETQLPLDVSPTSNVRTGAVAALAAHPLPRMIEAGLLVTLNSDDPPMFGTTLLDEYRAAHRMGLSVPELAQLARNGVRSGFADDATKRRVIGEIDRVAAGS